nr:unnamed protein product [Digitaria exilis]
MVKPGVVDDDEVDRKPVIKPGVHLKLKVQDTSGRTLERTVRRTEKLQGLMDAYYASVPDAGRLAGWQTPAELGMEEDDEIDFFTELLGGGGRAATTAAAGGGGGEQPVQA